MTLRVKLEIAAAVVVLLLVGIGLHSYQIERESRIRAEATTQAQQDVQKQLARQVSDLAKQMSEREAAYNAQFAKLQNQFQRASTPQDMAQLAALLMGLKNPITITTPSPTAANPNPQPVAQVSLNDFPQAKAYLQDCEECKLNLTKTQADLADRQKQADLAQQTIDSLKKDNASLQVAVKGGTKWQRTVRVVKVVVISAAAGYLLGHKF